MPRRYSRRGRNIYMHGLHPKRGPELLPNPEELKYYIATFTSAFYPLHGGEHNLIRDMAKARALYNVALSLHEEHRERLLNGPYRRVYVNNLAQLQRLAARFMDDFAVAQQKLGDLRELSLAA